MLLELAAGGIFLLGMIGRKNRPAIDRKLR
jgi:hypothetical protein